SIRGKNSDRLCLLSTPRPSHIPIPGRILTSSPHWHQTAFPTTCAGLISPLTRLNGYPRSTASTARLAVGRVGRLSSRQSYTISLLALAISDHYSFSHRHHTRPSTRITSSEKSAILHDSMTSRSIVSDTSSRLHAPPLRLGNVALLAARSRADAPTVSP